MINYINEKLFNRIWLVENAANTSNMMLIVRLKDERNQNNRTSVMLPWHP